MSARPHAPSAQRVAEARAAGHVPRVPLLGLLGPLGLLAVGATQRHAFAGLLKALFELPISGAEPWPLVHALMQRTAWSLAIVLALLLVGSWLAQGPALGTRRSTFRFQGIDRTAGALFVFGSVVLLGFFVLDVQLFSMDASYLWAWALLSVACLAIDIAFARARWFASLWMTRRELVDEQRDAGVSPELAAARKRARA